MLSVEHAKNKPRLLPWFVHKIIQVNLVNTKSQFSGLPIITALAERGGGGG